MNTATVAERQEAIEQIDSMIQDIEVAMLTTQAESGLLRSRPMISVARQFDGDLWFFSHGSDPRMRDIKANPRVSVVYSSPATKNYVSMCGMAKVIVDQRKFESLWKDDLREWLPDGVETGDLVLIKVEIDHAEFWDHHQTAMVHVMRYVKSKMSGEPIENVTHEEITWPRAVTPAVDEG